MKLKNNSNTIFLSDKLSNCISTYYINSLLAKPFVILTGNSGAGKTRIASQLANYLSFGDIKNIRTAFKVGDSFGEGKRTWIVSAISNDTIYLCSDENQNRLRPMPFKLIEEYISYISENPNIAGLSSNEGRSKIADLPNAEFDKYMYGFHATLILVAKEYLKRQKDIYADTCKKIKNHLLIPVGADWTDNTKILGFYNPLKKEYQSAPVLDFILLADQNPDIPFFLILDEMNLSHVERYFSDFLSAMESGEPIPLYKKDADCESSIPEEIVLPNNLFVTGTVNIDETTYMFSPKVLDRANVIEFKPEMDDVLENLLSPSENAPIKPAEPGVAEGFMKLANDVRSGNIPDEVKPILNDMKPILEAFYKELEKSGFEFAYRTVKEIRLYTIAAWLTAEDTKPTVTEIADIQILQKILPKIHGNRKQIGELLSKLEKLCVKNGEKKIRKTTDFEIVGTGNNTLPFSFEKIGEMQTKLANTQYASFI